MPKERRGLRFGLDDHLEGIVISEKQNLEEGIVKYPYEVPAKKKMSIPNVPATRSPHRGHSGGRRRAGHASAERRRPHR
jgi:hypothetical protein